MDAPLLHAVTGAFGYSGKYITRRLLDAGHRVITLTNSPNRPSPFGHAVTAHPFHFDDPPALAATLRGVDTLFNTYWVRFNHRTFTHAQAVHNTQTLFAAAKSAGVRRIVHVSITNPSEDSPLEYFRGKAILERSLRETGIPHSILRPAVLFGHEDILVNNIAWVIRHFPFYGLFGDGRYGIQPIHVDDFADLAVAAATTDGNPIIDAIGPETFTFRHLVETIASILDIHCPIISVSPAVGYAVARVAGWLVGDVVVTREEIDGLMEGLLQTDSPPAGRIKLTDWARAHVGDLGIHYASELARRRHRARAY